MIDSTTFTHFWKCSVSLIYIEMREIIALIGHCLPVFFFRLAEVHKILPPEGKIKEYRVTLKSLGKEKPHFLMQAVYFGDACRIQRGKGIWNGFNLLKSIANDWIRSASDLKMNVFVQKVT